MGQYLKSLDEDVMVVLSDPDGSGLYNKVKHGVMFDRREAGVGRKRVKQGTRIEDHSPNFIQQESGVRTCGTKHSINVDGREDCEDPLRAVSSADHYA